MRISDWSSDVCSSDLHAIGDVPAALADPVVGRDVIADEAEDHHHDMLGNADRVAEGGLGHRDAGLDRRVEIDMVGTDTSSERELKLVRLGDALGRQIGGPEGLGDYYLSVGQLLLKHRNGAVLARGDDQRMALRL